MATVAAENAAEGHDPGPDSTRSDDELFADVQGRNTADYVLRTAQGHHQSISALADNKANIIITVSSITLTILFGRINDTSLMPSVITLGAFTVMALLLAVLAVLPKFKPLSVRADNLPDWFNVLFFNHFAALTQREFMEEMDRVLTQDKEVYKALTVDLYGIGVYLQRQKFRYLRLSYLFFLAGFILAPLVQVIANLRS